MKQPKRTTILIVLATFIGVIIVAVVTAIILRDLNPKPSSAPVITADSGVEQFNAKLASTFSTTYTKNVPENGTVVYYQDAAHEYAIQEIATNSVLYTAKKSDSADITKSVLDQTTNFMSLNGMENKGSDDTYDYHVINYTTYTGHGIVCQLGEKSAVVKDEIPQSYSFACAKESEFESDYTLVADLSREYRTAYHYEDFRSAAILKKVTDGSNSMAILQLNDIAQGSTVTTSKKVLFVATKPEQWQFVSELVDAPLSKIDAPQTYVITPSLNTAFANSIYGEFLKKNI